MAEPIVVRRPVGPPPFALRLAAVLAVPLLLYALVATGQKAIENYGLSQQANSLRGEIADLRGQNLQLQQQIEQARTDAAIEKIAREQLGLVKSGDHPLVVVDQSSGAAPPPPPAPAPSGPGGSRASQTTSPGPNDATAGQPIATGDAQAAAPSDRGSAVATIGPTVGAASPSVAPLAGPESSSASGAAAIRPRATTGTVSPQDQQSTWRQWWAYFFG
jgi:cell division protein FtsB